MVTQQRLKELLRYDPETGIFVWIKTSSRRARAGTIAGQGRHTAGYSCIRVDGVLHRAHRLAWLYMTGEMPELQIDHINGDRGDNRWANLREATHQQNIRNSKLRSDNKWGMKGIRQLKSGRWYARIRETGREISVGTFDTAEQAHEAYMAKARELFGEFARAA